MAKGRESRRDAAVSGALIALALTMLGACALLLAGCSAGAESKGQGEYDLNAEGARTYTTAEAASAGAACSIEVVEAGATIMDDGCLNAAVVAENKTAGWLAVDVPVEVRATDRDGTTAAFTVVIPRLYPGVAAAQATEVREPTYAYPEGSQKALAQAVEEAERAVRAADEQLARAKEAASAGGVLGIELVVPSGAADDEGDDEGEGGDRPRIGLANVESLETEVLVDSATWMRTDLTASDVGAALSVAGESESREEGGVQTLAVEVVSDPALARLVLGGGAGGAWGGTVCAVFKGIDGNVVYGTAPAVVRFGEEAQEGSPSDAGAAEAPQGPERRAVALSIEGVPADEAWASYEIYASPGL